MSEVNDLPFPEEEGQINIPLTFAVQEEYTKSKIKDSAFEAIDNIADTGMTNPLDTYSKLKAIEQFTKDCIERITPAAIQEREAFGKEAVTKFGIPLVVKNAGKKFDFSHYEGWVELDDKIKDLTEQRKAIETKMKNAIGTAGIVDEETGEVIPPAVVTSEGKTILSASIPK